MDGETHGDEAAKVELAEGQEDARSAVCFVKRI